MISCIVLNAWSFLYWLLLENSVWCIPNIFNECFHFNHPQNRTPEVSAGQCNFIETKCNYYYLQKENYKFRPFPRLFIHACLYNCYVMSLTHPSRKSLRGWINAKLSNYRLYVYPLLLSVVTCENEKPLRALFLLG